MAGPKTIVELGGVPETMLWTLYHRALEARRRDAVLHDPSAVELVDAIDYPFESAFRGEPRPCAGAGAARVALQPSDARGLIGAWAQRFPGRLVDLRRLSSLVQRAHRERPDEDTPAATRRRRCPGGWT